MTGLGPFPIHAVIAAAATVIGWLVVRARARRLPDAPAACPHRVAVGLFVDAVLVGLLAARLGYVLLWWPEYLAAPKSIIAIGDGGFLWWIGLPAVIAFTWWRSARQGRLRKPLFAGIAAGLLAWFALNGTLALLQHSVPSLPDIATHTLDGIPTTLDASAGRPIVLNLWATWCPPCRREMPVFEDAAQRYPGIDFVLLNQGEDAATIREFLDRQGLQLHQDILLDPHSQAMPATNTRGLPTTLYFDANGRLVDSHMGELTRASLTDTLRKRLGAQAVTPARAKE